MLKEIRKKMRSRLILRHYMDLTVVDAETNMVTGTLYAVSDQNNEIVVFQTLEPVNRQVFVDKAAALETQLNEPWFELPPEIYDDGQ